MSSLISLLLLIAICAGSLLVVSWANHVDAKRKVLKARLKSLRSKCDELQQIIAAVDQTVEHREIARRLNQAAIDLVKDMQQLAPEDGYVVSTLSNCEALQAELQQDKTLGRIFRIRESDSQIALAQSQLDKAAAFLAQQQASGNLTPEQFNSYKLSLSWAHLMLPVISFIAQGNQASKRNEPLPAKGFYQKANSLLAQSPHPDARKAELRQELSELMSGQRQTVSDGLMPENALDRQPQQPPDEQQPGEDPQPEVA